MTDISFARPRPPTSPIDTIPSQLLACQLSPLRDFHEEHFYPYAEIDFDHEVISTVFLLFDINRLLSTSSFHFHSYLANSSPTCHRSPHSLKLAPRSSPIPLDPSLNPLHAHIHFSDNRDRHLIPSTYHSRFASRCHTMPATHWPIIAISRFSRTRIFPLCSQRFPPLPRFHTS